MAGVAGYDGNESGRLRSALKQSGAVHNLSRATSTLLSVLPQRDVDAVVWPLIVAALELLDFVCDEEAATNPDMLPFELIPGLVRLLSFVDGQLPETTAQRCLTRVLHLLINMTNNSAIGAAMFGQTDGAIATTLGLLRRLLHSKTRTGLGAEALDTQLKLIGLLTNAVETDGANRDRLAAAAIQDYKAGAIEFLVEEFSKISPRWLLVVAPAGEDAEASQGARPTVVPGSRELEHTALSAHLAVLLGCVMQEAPQHAAAVGAAVGNICSRVAAGPESSVQLWAALRDTVRDFVAVQREMGLSAAHVASVEAVLGVWQRTAAEVGAS
eukprot:TRINITY_DN7754_c0_g1_i1.p1 TRINITY_DN7754_c0_g1~~TRINITY_DN7754_c0_g1_i1.p1  ORF type:complete len:327 (-),score=61.35 TRINITY_DN7754_c0_g1_i1:43-1023(-)